MPFTARELAQVEKEVGDLSGRHKRPDVGLTIAYRINGYDVVVSEQRPYYDRSLGSSDTPIAKLKFIRKTGKWRLFWMRANQKWYAYETRSSNGRLHDLVSEIDADEYGCFFG